MDNELNEELQPLEVVVSRGLKETLLLQEIQIDLEEILEGFLFEFNNKNTRDSIVENLSDYLESWRLTDDIQDFKVKCDETNNTTDIIDRNMCIIDVGVCILTKWYWNKIVILPTGMPNSGNIRDIKPEIAQSGFNPTQHSV